MTSTKKGSTDLDAGDQSLTRVKHGTVSDYSLGPQPKLHAICKENMAFNSSSPGWVPVPVLKAYFKVWSCQASCQALPQGNTGKKSISSFSCSIYGSTPKNPGELFNKMLNHAWLEVSISKPHNRAWDGFFGERRPLQNDSLEQEKANHTQPQRQFTKAASQGAETLGVTV